MFQRPCRVCGVNKTVCCSGEVDLGADPDADVAPDPVCRDCCSKHSKPKRPVHKKLQPNGVCWDCDAVGARPVIRSSNPMGRLTLGLQHLRIEMIGWKCECGRWWEVRVSDMSNWAIAFLKMLLEEADGSDVGPVKVYIPDLEAIERILDAHHSGERGLS
jgi:hypothetical protein